jgi:hypothetical protein
MKYMKRAFLLSAAAIFSLLTGCAKDSSRVIDPETTFTSGTGAVLTAVTTLPGYIRVDDSLIVFTAKAANPGLVASIAVELTTNEQSIGSVALLDNGNAANGDKTAGDSVYSGVFRLSTDMANGPYTVHYVVTQKNAQSYVAAEQTFLYSNAKNQAPVLSNFHSTIADSIVVVNDVPFVYTVTASDPNGASDISKVYTIVHQANPSAPVLNLTLYDDGTHGDKTANDGIYSIGLTFGPDNTKGTYRFDFYAVDRLGAVSNTLTHYQTLQ